MHIDFKDKTVVVTGATRGIGAAIATLFQKSGANLILTGTNISKVNELNRNLPTQVRGKVRYEQVDFLDPDSLDNFLGMLDREKTVDVCVNNAGINILSPYTEIKSQDFTDVFEVNCVAPLRICQTVVKKMKSAEYGRIINISSIWSVISKANRASYTASKSAITGFTKTLSIEVAEHNIMVNCVSPGFTKTELTDRSMSKDEQENLKKIIPSKRLAEPEEIARVVLFLASSLNTYISGQNIIVDGGFVNV